MVHVYYTYCVLYIMFEQIKEIEEDDQGVYNNTCILFQCMYEYQCYSQGWVTIVILLSSYATEYHA